jgi:hypothetical protein
MLSSSDVRLFRCTPALIGRVEVIIYKGRDPGVLGFTIGKWVSFKEHQNVLDVLNA